MDLEATNRLTALRDKFDKKGPSSLSQSEGEEFVRLMREEAKSFVRAKGTKRAAKATIVKSTPATASTFASVLAKLRAEKEKNATPNS